MRAPISENGQLSSLLIPSFQYFHIAIKS